MFVTLVHVHVKPDRVEDFIASMQVNHEASIQEQGNFRFDVLQSVEDPTRFILHEWYVDETAAMAHRDTPHYLAWRALAEDWMAEPRVGVRYRGLFPVVPESLGGTAGA
jgi:autoinducer 2-degrading protein